MWDGIRSEKMNEVLNHHQVQLERCHKPHVQSTSYLLQKKAHRSGLKINLAL